MTSEVAAATAVVVFYRMFVVWLGRSNSVKFIFVARPTPTKTMRNDACLSGALPTPRDAAVGRHARRIAEPK